jgi:hypothetical protein
MKRSLLLLGTVALLFCGAHTAFAQIPNPGFENWTAASPDGWYTTNIAALGWVPVTQSTNKHSGTYALRGDVITLVTGGTYSPLISPGTASSVGGFAWTQRSATLTGYYQFFPAAGSGDHFFVLVALAKGGASGTGVAIGSADLTSAVSSYTQFSATLNWLSSAVPDWCTVSISITGPGSNSPHAGSYFLLDDLAFSGTASAVENGTVPQTFALEQNYPNPFNPSTNIRFSVAQTGHVSLKVYNVLGVEVASLVNEQKDAGTFNMNWNAAGLPSGMYLYRLSVTSDKGQVFEQSKKLVLLK